MIGLTKVALKRPVSVCIVVLALLIFGIGTTFSTPLELMPDIEMPALIVYTVYPGASPEDVENQVTSHIEDAASTLSGVKNIESISMENASLVVLEIEYGTNMDKAHSDLKNNIDMYRNLLPDDADNPTIFEMNMDMMPVITLSASAVGDVDLKYYVEEDIVPEIEKLGGVASVNVYGGSEEYIKVELMQEKLSQYGLTIRTLSDVIGAADFSLPAGIIEQGNLDLTLRGGVSYSTAEDLRHLPITLASGDIIHLSDVANVNYTNKEIESLSYYNGNENIILEVTKRQSASTIAMINSVKKVVEEINTSNKGIQIDIVDDKGKSIISAVVAVAETLALGVVLAMIVLFIFLGDWRASLIVGSSIPISLLVTMIAMSGMGFSFNTLSLSGLVIGVGMMVDNSIVVIESCFRLKTKNQSFYESALEGTKAVASSIIASTATTVVVFLPIAFIKGLSGQLFGQLCFTIVFSLIASLLSALAIVPLVFYHLKPVEHEPKIVMRIMDKISTSYANFLPLTLRHKKTVVALAVILLVGSLALVPLIGVELLPATDDGVINISLSVRPGTNNDRIHELLSPLEQMVTNHPDVEHYSMVAGKSGFAMAMGNNSDASITAYLKKDRKTSTKDLVDQWRSETKDPIDCDISIAASSQTEQMGGGTNVSINLQSTDFDSLKEGALKVEEMMRQNPHILHVTSTLASGKPQAEVKIDPVKASAQGLVPKQVMGTIYSIMQGSEACKLMENGREYEVRVEYPNDQFQTVSDLASFNLTNAAGMPVPLFDIATIEYSNSPLSISRQNGRYIITLSGQPASSAPNDLSKTLNAQAESLQFPKGVELTKTADSERMQEEFTALIRAILTAVLLVFMVMAMQFESPVFSIVVMISIPFALIGSFLCLFIFDCTISMPSLLGFLMLAGIVVNNGILFIDTTNSLRVERNLSAEDALLTSGMLRMRPIFMTTLTTVLAMVPMAIGIGGNAALMRGMAFVIIGGLVASTTLTLLLLPTFYLLFDKQERLRKKQLKKEKKAAKKAAKRAALDGGSN
ncbi:efflux RND transporter permease subunit [Oscillospiraceae bacterium LTW-04]|nr:efflux RND transporter permease subunit [Oscillospiraceae bacterium MB24-C1]